MSRGGRKREREREREGGREGGREEGREEERERERGGERKKSREDTHHSDKRLTLKKKTLPRHIPDKLFEKRSDVSDLTVLLVGHIALEREYAAVELGLYLVDNGLDPRGRAGHSQQSLHLQSFTF